MPRGSKKIAKAAEESRARREAYDAGGGDSYQRALVIKPGQSATGRFLEGGDAVMYPYVHDLPKKAGQSIADKILCLDQDDQGVACYACEQDIRRGTRLVMNFIRYDEPKLKRDSQGKPVKDQFNNYLYEMEVDPDAPAPGPGEPIAERLVVEPALVVFSTGSSLSTRIDFLETKHGEMTNHVVTISRTHDNTSPYMIDVDTANKPPEEFERALFAKKIDPLKAITQLGKRSIPAPSYGDMVRLYGGTVPSGFAPGEGSLDPSNPYAQASKPALNLGAFQ